MVRQATKGMQKATLKPTPLFGAANQVLVPTMVRLRLQFSYWQITQGQANFVPMSEHKKNLSMPDKDYFKVT